MNVFSVFQHLQKDKQRKQRHSLKLGKKRRESYKRNYYIISPRVIIKAIIIMSAIDVTAKKIFERLYLVPGQSSFEPRVKCLCAPTLPLFAISRFLWKNFPDWPLNFFCHHHSPSNLAKSRYPRGVGYVSNGRRFSVQSSLQRISSIFWCGKETIHR